VGSRARLAERLGSAGLPVEPLALDVTDPASIAAPAAAYVTGFPCAAQAAASGRIVNLSSQLASFGLHTDASSAIYDFIELSISGCR